MKLKAALYIKMLFLCVPLSLFLLLSNYCSIYPVYTFIFIAVRFFTSGFWSHIILYMEVKAHFESFFCSIRLCDSYIWCNIKENIREPIRPH